jgi:Peptidase A4 family
MRKPLSARISWVIAAPQLLAVATTLAVGPATAAERAVAPSGPRASSTTRGFSNAVASAFARNLRSVGRTLPGNTATATLKSASSDAWAGYVGIAPHGKTFKNVGAIFVVPHVKCSDSVGAPSHSKRYPGWHASFWVGLDGWNPGKKVTNGTVQQVGVISFCPTKKSAATYRAFYEMFPAGPVLMKRPVVHAGERLDLFVGVAGKTYTFEVSHNATSFPPTTAMCAKHTTCRNTTAEVITEAPGGGPDAKHGLAGTGTVTYTYAAAAYSDQQYDATPLGNLTGLTKITMNPKGYPGIVKPGKIRMGPDGPADFKTYWR